MSSNADQELAGSWNVPRRQARNPGSHAYMRGADGRVQRVETDTVGPSDADLGAQARLRELGNRHAGHDPAQPHQPLPGYRAADPPPSPTHRPRSRLAPLSEEQLQRIQAGEPVERLVEEAAPHYSADTAARMDGVRAEVGRLLRDDVAAAAAHGEVGNGRRSATPSTHRRDAGELTARLKQAYHGAPISYYRQDGTHVSGPAPERTSHAFIDTSRLDSVYDRATGRPRSHP